jgi:hypothetical protein
VKVLKQDIIADYIFVISVINIKFGLAKPNKYKIMKKLFLAILFIAVLTPSTYSQFTKIGTSLSYDYRYVFNDETNDLSLSSHKLKNPILSFSAIYELNLPFHIVPSFNIYFPNINKSEEIPGYILKTSLSAFSLDIDGHYVVNYLDEFEVYCLAGFNILYAKMKVKDTQDGEVVYTGGDTNTALGLNLGGGAYWKIKDEFDLFFEAKAVLFDHPASGIKLRGIATAGILLNMEYLWSKEKESGY